MSLWRHVTVTCCQHFANIMSVQHNMSCLSEALGYTTWHRHFQLISHSSTAFSLSFCPLLLPVFCVEIRACLLFHHISILNTNAQNLAVHDRRSKHRCLRSNLIAADHTIKRIDPSHTYSPTAASSPNVDPSINNDESHHNLTHPHPPPHRLHLTFSHCTRSPSNHASSPLCMLRSLFILTRSHRSYLYRGKGASMTCTPLTRLGTSKSRPSTTSPSDFSDDSSLIVIHRTMDGKSLWRHFMVLAVIVNNNKASIGDNSVKA